MNCKPGDLAIIIGASRTPELIGYIVEVVSLAYDREAYETNKGVAALDAGGEPQLWRVRGTRPLPWRIRDGSLAYAVEVPVRDVCLRPLNGIPVDEETGNWVHI